MGDGKNLSFEDNAFDLIVCVGVLEHIHPYEELERMAREIRRVGKSYVVVVPHLFTPIEPHFQLPFWQFYPNVFKSFLVKKLSLPGNPRNPEGRFRKLNYFKKNEWQALFPGSSIISYNHIGFGLIRNLIIYRK